MQNDTISFLTGDGTSLEILQSPVEEPRATLLMWPCMGGSVRMYRCPVDLFNKAGVSVIQFNPRGHGESGGQFVPEDAIADLGDYLFSRKRDSSPLWILGHSAGANAVLQYGTAFGGVDRFFLVSPVLDSIESLRYMYRINTILEFNEIVAALTSERDFVLDVLSNDRWMDPAIWQKNYYRHKFDDISENFRVGIFLERLFIEGYNAFEDLISQAEKTSILVAPVDTWYPFETIERLAREGNIPVHLIKKARDHFFTGGWKAVWAHLLDQLNSHYPH